jgi:hypothetical protein
VARVARFRLAVVALILGAAAVAAAWVATYREFRGYYGPALSNPHSQSYVSPAWTTPVAALIGIAAVGTSVLAFRRSR